MRIVFLGLTFFLLTHFTSFAQLDSISVTEISFTPGTIYVQDTSLQMPVMEIKMRLPDPVLLGKITVDIFDSTGTVFFVKKELQPEAIISLWMDGSLAFQINEYLDPEMDYIVKTTLQTPELFYLPQLINTYSK